MADRLTKAQLVEALAKAGFKVTSNRREGRIELDHRNKPIALRWIEVLVPGSMWSLEVGDWCDKRKQRANEKRIYAAIKAAIGKAASFDLIGDDMGHSSEGDAADDAHLSFYAYTAD